MAHEIGFPVLIKATAGGGGKGMRVASNDLALKTALSAGPASRPRPPSATPASTSRSTSSDPRHVEVQIIADNHGNVVHLWERDCSMQRRHQKLIEESPAPNLPDKIRQAMCECAVRLVKRANYTNAGTVEFIVDQNNNFYFIEVNARIQVEHPVTEMVTGIDLIKSQILVASGEPLPFRQKDIQVHGCAIECRINAENPTANFQPSPGTIQQADHARRARRAVGFARPPGLHRAAVLRFDDRQADRASADARRGHRLHAARWRTASRASHDRAVPRKVMATPIRRRLGRHELRRRFFSQGRWRTAEFVRRRRVDTESSSHASRSSATARAPTCAAARCLTARPWCWARLCMRGSGSDGHAQCTGRGFEDRLGDVVAVAAVVQHDVEVAQRVGRQRPARNPRPAGCRNRRSSRSGKSACKHQVDSGRSDRRPP